MSRKKATPRLRQQRGAYGVMRDDVTIVRQNIQEEWDKGCKWAGIAFALTFGPMMALGVYWGWL